jgi:hypothetical protein
LSGVQKYVYITNFNAHIYTNKKRTWVYVLGVYRAGNSSWLCRARSKLTSPIWRQILNKIPMYQILKNTYSCKNILRIFLNFIQDTKKWCFYVYFEEFTSKSTCSRTCHPPIPLSFTLVSDHPKPGVLPQHTVICSPTSASHHQHQIECWGLGPQLGPLSGSF